MIDLLTGLPGNAKTLHGLELWINRAAAENRPVYYDGIKELLVDDPRLKGTSWIKFDAVRWHLDVPSGALVFIDEGQKIFRNRTVGAHPPMHVTELEEHRHKGLDFLIITQHPSLIDPAIRRLTQTHRHMVRIFGMEASTVHRWNGTKDNCDKSRADSESSKWLFRKDMYGLYKSADAHTMKRSIPMRLKLLLAVPFVLALCGWAVYTKVVKPPPVAPVAGAQVAPAQKVGSGPAGGAVGGKVPFDPIADARSFVDQSTPRVAGLAFTAPKYDELTKPVRVPIPAACIQRGDVQRGDTTCKCLSQQGTPLDVPLTMCVQFARNGWFQEFDADKDQKDSARTRQSEAILASRPDSPPSSSVQQGSVLAFGSSSPVVEKFPAGPVKPAEEGGAATAAVRRLAGPPKSS